MVALLIVRIVLILNTFMEVNKMEIGDCYICSTDKGKTFGFVLLQKDFTKDKSNAMRFGVVCFKQNTITSIEDFKKGELFTHNVYIGMKGDYKMGVFCYDVYQKDFEFLKKFKQLGNIKINNEKFIYGSGTNYTNELFFNLEFNIIEQSKASDYKREGLTTIIAK